jgi:signal transduction histidine kinase
MEKKILIIEDDKDIIEIHNCNISAHSEPDRGTTFTFDLFKFKN